MNGSKWRKKNGMDDKEKKIFFGGGNVAEKARKKRITLEFMHGVTQGTKIR